MATTWSLDDGVYSLQTSNNTAEWDNLTDELKSRRTIPLGYEIDYLYDVLEFAAQHADPTSDDATEPYSDYDDATEPYSDSDHELIG